MEDAPTNASETGTFAQRVFEPNLETVVSAHSFLANLKQNIIITRNNSQNLLKSCFLAKRRTAAGSGNLFGSLKLSLL